MKIYHGLSEAYLNPNSTKHILGLRQDNVSDKHFKAAMIVLTAVLLAGLIIISSCKVVHASEIPMDKAVLAIIGEAESQGYTGLLAVACALRNRGTLKGVYGLNAPRVKKHLYSQKTYDMATRAWVASYRIDITHGSTGWGNANDGQEFAKCKWWKNCVVVFRYKDHFFYREA